MADDRAVLHFRIVIVILLLQKTAGCQDACSAVGLVDSNIIPDSSFTASSELIGGYYGAKKARFSSDRCWEPKDNNNASDYLQIDLGKVFVICAVATKGNAASHVSEWTTEYKISTSSDGTLWITYSANASTKLFPGNTDKNSDVKNVLAIPVLAKLIRFTPTQFKTFKALRVEVYGIYVQDFSCKSLPVGVASVVKIPDNSMTSSSQYNTSTPPSNGRLGYTAGSSWCAATSDSSPYLQVKMSSPYIICGVATQGDHKSDQWVQTYQIQTSTDGSSFTDYKHNNVIKDFVGNTDSGTVVKKMLYEGTVSQYIRINAKSNYGTTPCMRTELYGVQQNTVCSKMSVGVPYSSLIPDHRFTASSYFIGLNDRYIPSNARLKNTKAWEPKTTNVGDWLQIDLGFVVYVCAVATQGNSYLVNEYVKKYKLRISLDNVNWRYYQEHNADKVFTGNTNRTTIVTNTLAVPTKTKFLRFYPTEFEKFAAMRVDVYGVPATCRSPFGVEKGGSVKDSNMTSSSKSDSSHYASFGRLYGNASWCSHTSPSAEYIQIDLGKMVTLTGIATQGDHAMDKWVKTYTLTYSIDGSVWNDYRGDQPSAKVFQGNSNRTSIVVRWFSHPVTVRYVRVYPQSWNTAICMRIELFGCTCPSPKEITELSNKNLAATSSSYVDLECNVQELLIKYIDWYSDGIDVTNLSGGITRTANFVKSVLRVNYTNVDNVLNTYQCKKDTSFVTCRKNIACRAKYAKVNIIADSIKGAEVIVNLEYPSAPSLSPVGSILSRSVVVRWSHPSLKVSQASIQTYVIKYWNSGTTKTISVSHTATSHTISSLSVCTSYNVTIKAVSKLGEGPWSNTKTFKTDSEAPSAPRNVTVSVISSIGTTGPRIRIDWDRPLSSYGIIRGYKVSYGKTGDPNPRLVTLSSSTFNTSLPVCGGERYIIELWAFNSNERAKVKQSVSIPSYVPNSPKDITYTKYNTTTYRLSWKPVNSESGRIFVYEMRNIKMKMQSYEKKEMINISCSEVRCGGTVNHDCSYSMHNTQQCFAYNISVRAYTTKGPGPFSKPLEINSPALPMAPKELTVISVDHNTASLEWKEPDNKILAIKYYTIKYSGQSPSIPSCAYNDSFMNGKVVYVTNSTEITITGLYPATRYRFTVSATTECGEGKDSEEQVNQTKSDQHGKKGQSQENIYSTTETKFLISLAFNVVFVVIIIILLLVYRLYLRKKGEKQSTERNSKYGEKASPQQIVYENTRVDRGTVGSIQMSDIPATIAQVYDSIDEYQNSQNPSHPTMPSTSHGNSNTSASDLPSEAYQALDISQQKPESVYEELNRNTKAEVPLSSGQSGDSLYYQSLTMDIQNSPYQRLHMDG